MIMSVRLCAKNTKFSIKEVDIGIVAGKKKNEERCVMFVIFVFFLDIGTTARFPKIIGNRSTYAELLFTGRFFDAKEAKDIGFVSQV